MPLPDPTVYPTLPWSLDAKTGRPRTIQAFPFVYVTAAEVQALLDLIQEHYFNAPTA